MRRPCLPVACASSPCRRSPGPRRSQPRGSSLEEKKDVSVRLFRELKAHYRWSEDDRFPLRTPFPPEFVPVGQENVALQTVAPGSSLEVSKATLSVDVSLPRQVSARVKLDFIDLYDRNPTETDKKVDVDEAWIRSGGGRSRSPRSRAPPSTRSWARRRSSSASRSGAWRATASSRPLSTASPTCSCRWGLDRLRVLLLRPGLDRQPDFLRDPNVLAGDNGTGPPPPPNPDPALHSGFPIFYHAEVEDLEFDDRFESGGGGGFRFLSADRRFGVDVLGFYYGTRALRAGPPRRDLLPGRPGAPAGGGHLPDQLSGDERTEYGGNLDLRFGGFTAFAQLVKEEAASLPRTGFEIEASYRLVLGYLADAKSLFPSIEPASATAASTTTGPPPRSSSP